MLVWFLLFRWGMWVPILGGLSVLFGFIGNRLLHVGPGAAPISAGAIAFVLAGASLWFVTYKLEEGSGEVYYDAENDRPVVVGETAGHFIWIPLRVWIFILPFISGAVAALVSLPHPTR